jgi:pimeloyl-ACP methyl ester carboxylesterase
MAEVNGSIGPPSRWLLALEGRAVGELVTTWAVMPLLAKNPTGDGHPVLVLPGFLATDVSTGPLRSFLDRIRLSPHAWLQGRNYGPVGDLEERLVARLDTLHQRYRRKVSIVGWSLGGVYARLIAHQRPDSVRAVITLGSPFNHPTANHARWLFERLSGTPIADIDPERIAMVRTPPPVPSTAIYTRTDGVTAWQSCIDHVEGGRRTENIEVPGSHCGLGCNPLVLHAIADRLTQPEHDWRPFERTGVRRVLYPAPRRSPGHGHRAPDDGRVAA